MFATIVDDLRVALVWMRHELGLIGGWLRDIWLWAAVVAGLLLTVLAYQMTPAFTLHIGGDKNTRLRWYDSPFLHGFHAPEPDRPQTDWWALPEQPYRWAEDAAEIELPGVGGGPWLVTLSASSGRPDGTPTTAQITIGAGQQQSILIAPQVRRYYLLGNAEQGDLKLLIQTPRFVAANDPRPLGVVIYRLYATPPITTRPTPAPGQLLLQLLIIALIAGCARFLHMGARMVAILALVLGTIAAGLLIFDRLGLTIATPGLAVIAGACLILALLFAPLLAAASRGLRVVASTGERGAVVGTVVAGFAARMTGATHPYARYSDLQFNVNNMLRVIGGELFLTAGLPCDAGAGRAPYPPAQYILQAPLRLLLEFGSRDDLAMRLMQGSVACFEATGSALIWLILRRCGLSKQAALFGALLYILPLPLLRSYSVGEMANLFGQVLVPPLLLLLITWPPPERIFRWAVVGGLLWVGLLFSHTGVTISAACLLAAWGFLQLVTRRQSQLMTFSVALILAGIAALLLFYSAYAYLPGQNRANTQALAAVGQICPPGYPFGPKLLGNLGLGIGPQGSLSVPFVLAAFVGLLCVRHTRLRLLLVAAVLGLLLSLGTLLVSDQPVRWAHFLYPSVCLAAGVGLAAWARRGSAGRVLVGIIVAYVAWFSADAWIGQIADYLH